MDDDFYAQWYSAKLWQMLPPIYRQLDSLGLPSAQPPGPLQELINRIGAQAAVLRRSIDRMWENQSIETCDDWVIPYIGDLLATRIVSCLNARAKRLDVAKTIYYRRRSGTLGLIEELCSDIAGHDARAVEFFRRLSRTRHNFDPPIGLVPNLSIYPSSAALLAGPPPPSVIEGLAGMYTQTPAGGYADLRNTYGAQNAGTAFDEYTHTADFRRGRQSIGWQNIPHLGVFIWWLYAFPVSGSTPVERAGCPGQYTFDPTGREIPLFAPSQRAAEDFVDSWVSPNDWQLPIAIRRTLWNLLPEALYQGASTLSQGVFSIAVGSGPNPPIQPYTDFAIDPPAGRFRFLGGPPAAGVAVFVNYSFGFSSTVGAGFDPSFLPTLATPAATMNLGMGTTIDSVLAALSADATLLFQDSTTFAGPLVDAGASAAPPVNLALVAQTGMRPVLRWTMPGSWTVTGHAGSLILQGLWLQGGDLVIAGNWDSVTLRLCTIDPGTADPQNPGQVLSGIDGVKLAPSHIYIDGQVATLTVQNCITGPIAARNGAFKNLVVNNSILQAMPPDTAALQSDAGSAALSRTTVLGRINLHELSASECILDDVATVENSQAGCVRFSTLALGHNLHAPYRCATVAPVSSILESRGFGDPNYARVSAGADLAIIADLNTMPAPSVLYGAANGAQPGAFCAEQKALTQRGLAAKLEEYAPISLTPVWVDADLAVNKDIGGTP
jgi:hypothetical protein